jgi:hypothetical protein
VAGGKAGRKGGGDWWGFLLSLLCAVRSGGEKEL